ncbi:MAG: membrane protein insertion efficiency factor YidD [candidate division WOR-3 bacterium]
MITRLARIAIRSYQYTLGLVLPDACRFQPTCSEYALQAIERHGAAGLWLALHRILRCHPWGGYGYDPVPSPANAVRIEQSVPGTRNGPTLEELTIPNASSHAEQE